MQEPRHTVPPSGELPPALLAQMRLLVAAGRAAASDSDEAEDEFTALADEILSLADENARRKRVEFLGWENELDVLDALEGMLEGKAEALTIVDLETDADASSAGDIRPEVREMIRTYRTGTLAFPPAIFPLSQPLKRRHPQRDANGEKGDADSYNVLTLITFPVPSLDRSNRHRQSRTRSSRKVV